MRDISLSFRRSVESVLSPEVDLAFVTISHPSIADPIRVVSDTVDYSWGGYTWVGFPFDIQLLTDNDQPPTARMQFQNVDQLIGQGIQLLSSAPRLRLQLLSSADFDLTVEPRVPYGEPSVEYDADKLFLSNVQLDALTVSAQIVGWDYLQRSWPGIRATQNRLPGLFR
jgi:hypothetical protein